jgi:hypothetical protein
MNIYVSKLVISCCCTIITEITFKLSMLFRLLAHTGCELTTGSTALLQTLTVDHLVKKCIEFYGSRIIIIVFRNVAIGPYPEPDESSSHLLVLCP